MLKGLFYARKKSTQQLMKIRYDTIIYNMH